jgi:hypothetical protein
VTIHCINCDKPVKPNAPMVTMSIGLRLYGPDFADRVRPSEDQGMFEIGPDCYKKVVAAGRDGYPKGGPQPCDDCHRTDGTHDLSIEH